MSMHQDSTILRLIVEQCRTRRSLHEHSQALVCSRPATTPTRPELHTLTSFEDRNVRHPAPPPAGPRRFHICAVP